MVERSKGSRQKTRKKLKRKRNEKGKIFIKRFTNEFKEGDKVVIKPDSSFQKGLMNSRFMGKSGEILKKRGRGYEVLIRDGNKKKIIITYPIHLKKVSK